jgi:hypothetical protein
VFGAARLSILNMLGGVKPERQGLVRGHGAVHRAVASADPCALPLAQYIGELARGGRGGMTGESRYNAPEGTERRGAMSKVRRIHRVLTVGGMSVLVLTACAGLGDPPTALAPADYAFHKKGKDLAIHWNLIREADQVTARGYVQSVTPPTLVLKAVHLALVAYDVQGRRVARSGSVFSIPSDLNVEEPPHDKGTFEVSMALGDPSISRLDIEAFYLLRSFPDEKRRRIW